MQVDLPVSAPTAIEDLLQAEAENTRDVAAALTGVKIVEWTPLSDDLAFLRDLEPDETANSCCGMTIYSVEDPSGEMLGLEQRRSKLFIERDCFAPLYKRLVDIWTEDKRKKIILSGNAGIGKSWFQIYFLHRLLTERQNSLFRFAVRQVGKDFFLIDLVSCSGFVLNGRELHIRTLLNNLGKTLYMYEPASEFRQPPLTTTAPSLSTLSPRPDRISEYKKQGPYFLYLPCWGFNELRVISERERMDGSVLEDNYSLFGGIARHTLEHDSKIRAVNKGELEKRCKSVSAAMLRSISADIDDNPNAENRNNISGYVVSYTDIPQVGENCFMNKNLTMTSEFARKMVLDKMSLQSSTDYLLQLAKHLKNESKDITGKDLEVSVVHLLAAGPRKVPWYYQAVGGKGAWLPGTKLHNTKRVINREVDFDSSKINYPKERMFGLIDCFTEIDRQYWAFQTTWQYEHAFRLVTLLEFRKKLGLHVNDPLNVAFLNPVHGETYWKRDKDSYLAKGERLTQPIMNSKSETILGQTDVARMWANTHIFVAFPQDNNWEGAIRKWLKV